MVLQHARLFAEFNLRDYAKAWALYDSNRAYWEKLYGDDPVTSPNHPASPPKSLLPRRPGASDPEYDLRNPAATGANAFGPFGTGAPFAAGSATSSRPLYEMQSIASPIGPTPPGDTEDDKSARRLGVRIEDTPSATAFDSGAPAVRFVSPNQILPSGRPATFDERFQPSLPPAGMPSGAASPDDLEAFRRNWLKSFLEP